MASSCFYLGPPNSYTHQAALRFSKSSPSLPTLQACSTIPAVFTALASAAAESPDADIAGVVPVENSTNGPVAATLDALAGHLSASLSIVAEVRVPVRHCLVAHPRATPSTAGAAFSAAATAGSPQRPDLSHLRALHTHPQAWSQCSRFLGAYGIAPPPEKGPNSAAIACFDATSTSSAAALAAADSTGETAAISSPLAAESLGLDIILQNLQDSDANVTRFLVLKPARPSPPFAAVSTGFLPGGRRKALVAFELAPSDPARPGALSDALAVFKTFGLSLSSINTRPRGGDVPWQYCFLVEVDLGGADGQAVVVTSDDVASERGCKRLDDALGRLDLVVGKCRWKGTWSFGGM